MPLRSGCGPDLTVAVAEPYRNEALAVSAGAQNHLVAILQEAALLPRGGPDRTLAAASSAHHQHNTKNQLTPVSTRHMELTASSAKLPTINVSQPGRGLTTCF